MGFFSCLFRRNKPKKIKIGIALGSGGAKGFAHIGALKAFEENGIEFEEIVQEGCIGILEAVNRFDINKGTKFLTYATSYIEKYILLLPEKYGYEVYEVDEETEEKTYFSFMSFDGENEKLSCKSVTYGDENDGYSQSARLFDALRELDEKGATKVYARCPSTKGMGLAVYNRLIRAAGFKIKVI